VGICCADHATPSIRKKLALTSPASGGRLVGIVRLQTKRHGVNNKKYVLIFRDLKDANVGIKTVDTICFVEAPGRLPRSGPDFYCS
jgi:hypothetical protein